MNKTSTDKIKSATPFLIWFCRSLPPPLQAQVRPYLDRPYQLALNILDQCNSSQPLAVKEIAAQARVAQETTRQVLLALKEGGMPFAMSPTRGWQSSKAESFPDSDIGCKDDANVLTTVLPADRKT